jgi:hypothetical protein
MLYQDVPANEIRLPDAVEGTALRVTRYGQVRAVVIHPTDFEMIETLIDAYRSRPPVEPSLSELELRAHAATEATETADDYDYAGLAAALDDE